MTYDIAVHMIYDVTGTGFFQRLLVRRTANGEGNNTRWGTHDGSHKSESHKMGIIL